VALSDDDPLMRLICLPVKNYGLDLADPIESTEANFRASKVTISHIIQVIRGLETFSFQDHRATSINEKAELKKQKEARHKDVLTRILQSLPKELSRTIMHGCETGVLLSVLPSTIADT
jgi:hypothetical protein